MNVRRWAMGAAILVVGVVLGRGVGSTAADGDDAKALGQKYAKMQVRLAELNLLKINEMNKKVPGTVVAPMVQMFVDDVELAKAHLAAVEKNGAFDGYLASLDRAEMNVRAAAARTKRTEETHQQAPAFANATDVERARVAQEVAILQFERGKSLANGSPDQKCQWQLEFLSDEIARVRQYASLIGQNRLAQF